MSEEKKISFDAALKRIEDIAALLEKGEQSLEESIKLYEEGSRLTDFCSERLKDAEQKITRIEG